MKFGENNSSDISPKYNGKVKVGEDWLSKWLLYIPSLVSSIKFGNWNDYHVCLKFKTILLLIEDYVQWAFRWANQILPLRFLKHNYTVSKK